MAKIDFDLRKNMGLGEILGPFSHQESNDRSKALVSSLATLLQVENFQFGLLHIDANR